MKLKYLLAASALTLSAAAILPAPVAAQQITTGIEGTVTDEAGNPVEGATVTITDTRTGADAHDHHRRGRHVRRDRPGHRRSLHGDRRRPTASKARRSPTSPPPAGQHQPDLRADQRRRRDRRHRQPRARDPARSRPGHQLHRRSARRTRRRFNRDVRDIIRIDPRVSLDRDDGGSGADRISCLGGNDRGNAFTVDGISQGDIYGLNDTGFSSRSSTPMPYDAVRETQVQFAPFDVEYGKFTGCAINVVTKSGANEFHGGAFFEYSDNGLRGNTVDGRPVAPIEPDKRWGVSLGGPIIQDRLFFFGAYEHQEAGQSQDDGPAGAGYPERDRRRHRRPVQRDLATSSARSTASTPARW